MTDKFACAREDFKKILDNRKHDILQVEYMEYVARCNDLKSTKRRDHTFPLSFDEWWRAMADNAKDRAKYE